MDALRRQWKEQALWRLQAGPSWQETGLVFTDQLGGCLPYWNVYRDFKRLAAEIGLPSLRFHDLRHPYVKPTTKNKLSVNQKSQAINRLDSLRFPFL